MSSTIPLWRTYSTELLGLLMQAEASGQINLSFNSKREAHSVMATIRIMQSKLRNDPDTPALLKSPCYKIKWMVTPSDDKYVLKGWDRGQEPAILALATQLDTNHPGWFDQVAKLGDPLTE